MSSKIHSINVYDAGDDRKKQCERCQQWFPIVEMGIKFCKPCGKQRKNELSQAKNKRRNAKKSERIANSLRQCLLCKQIFKRKDMGYKYCKECATKAAVLAQQRKRLNGKFPLENFENEHAWNHITAETEEQINALLKQEQKDRDAWHKIAKESKNEYARVRARAWYEKNKEQRRKHKLIRRIESYGITYNQFCLMLDRQQDKCAICKIDFDNAWAIDYAGNRSRTACIDHCHKTGKVRGLLCSDCNTAIGLLKEKVKIAINAAEYLRWFEDLADKQYDIDFEEQNT